MNDNCYTVHFMAHVWVNDFNLSVRVFDRHMGDHEDKPQI